MTTTVYEIAAAPHSWPLTIPFIDVPVTAAADHMPSICAGAADAEVVFLPTV